MKILSVLAIVLVALSLQGCGSFKDITSNLKNEAHCMTDGQPGVFISWYARFGIAAPIDSCKISTPLTTSTLK